MNRAEMIDTVATQANLTKADAGKVIDSIFAAITDALSRGDEVKLAGFGNFSVADRPERPGKNPRTGEPITIPASRQPKFKPGKALKDALNPPA